MNVFILCTGRCGSTTFIRACQHITNYTSGHETRSAVVGRERLAYPPNHIEADNRLSWFLGRLDRTYGDSAFYVHLKRDIDSTAKSFANRHDRGIMRAYHGDGIIPLGHRGATGAHMGQDRRIEIATDYCRTVEANIDLFLRDKSDTLTVELETIEDDFSIFWDKCQAIGNFASATEELQQMHNASEEIEQDSRPGPVTRSLNKMGRLAGKLPSFIKNA